MRGLKKMSLKEVRHLSLLFQHSFTVFSEASMSARSGLPGGTPQKHKPMHRDTFTALLASSSVCPSKLIRNGGLLKTLRFT